MPHGVTDFLVLLDQLCQGSSGYRFNQGRRSFHRDLRLFPSEIHYLMIGLSGRGNLWVSEFEFSLGHDDRRIDRTTQHYGYCTGGFCSQTYRN